MLQFTRMALEYVEGANLEQLLNSGPLPVDNALVVTALSAAHGTGIIHLDIKPSNIYRA